LCLAYSKNKLGSGALSPVVELGAGSGAGSAAAGSGAGAGAGSAGAGSAGVEE